MNLYRFKLTNETKELIERFSILHKEATRNDFNHSWNEFLDTNNKILQNENNKLMKEGFKGNFNEKIYKSARYYFRNKKENNNVQQRRPYISLDKSFITIINNFINDKRKQNVFKPSEGYEEFYNKYKDIINKEIDNLLNKNLTKKDAENKFKKTFKNRYFQLIKRNKK